MPLVFSLSFCGACRPHGDLALPPEDDLYLYSQRVAERALRLVPGEAALGTFHLGRVHARFGHEDRALQAYAEASRLDPKFVDAYKEIGFLLSKKSERHAEAEAAYRRALEIDPRAPGVRTRLGLMYLHQRRLEEAERVLREELAEDPRSALAQYTLGQVLALTKRPQEAIERFQSAIELDPRNPMALYALSQSLADLGREAESSRALEEFQRLKKEAEESERALPGSPEEEGRRAAAETWLDAAILLRVGKRRAQDPAERERLDREVLRAIRESLRFDPSLSETYELLFAYCEERGEYEEAALRCGEALGNMPTKSLAESALRLAVRVSEKLPPEGPERDRRVDLALGILRKLLAVQPESSRVHFEFARVILFLRPTDEALLRDALEHAQEAARLDPADPRAMDLLAFAFLANGDIEKAREKLEEAVSLFPADEELRERLSRFQERFPRR